MTPSLKDKTVLVAGGASGMGLAVARQALEAGAHVHLVGRNIERLALAAQSFASNRVQAHVADIANEGDVRRLAETVGRVDHVVTTAAQLAFKPFLELSDADIYAVMGAKFWGVIYLVRHLAPRMPAGGSFTFFSGSAAYKASAGASVVAAANAGLDGLARTLAVELSGIRVNVVSPGVVDSPTWDFLPESARAATLASIGSSLPVGRVGTADELGRAALFAMTNGFMTGAILQVDGGLNA